MESLEVGYAEWPQGATPTSCRRGITDNAVRLTIPVGAGGNGLSTNPYAFRIGVESSELLLLLWFSDWFQAVQWSLLCRSWRELSDEPLIAKLSVDTGVETAENESETVSRNLGWIWHCQGSSSTFWGKRHLRSIEYN